MITEEPFGGKADAQHGQRKDNPSCTDHDGFAELFVALREFRAKDFEGLSHYNDKADHYHEKAGSYDHGACCV